MSIVRYCPADLSEQESKKQFNEEKEHATIGIISFNMMTNIPRQSKGKYNNNENNISNKLSQFLPGLERIPARF